MTGTSNLLERTGTYTSPGRPGFDIHDTVGSICDWLQPESYLEVGVDGGGSLGAVLEHAPELRRIVLCDIWNPKYCNHELTDHDHIDRFLAERGYQGAVEYLDGDSHILLPALPRDLCFDLITIDGDHSAEGARRDLDDAWPHLNLGGVLVIDDVAHPRWPWIAEVVREFARNHTGDAIELREAQGRANNTTAFRKIKELYR